MYPFEAGTQLSAGEACSALETFVTEMRNIYQPASGDAETSHSANHTSQELRNIFSEHLRATMEHFARLEQVFETLGRRYKL